MLYSDLNLKYKKKSQTLQDIASIEQSLSMIIGTSRGERLFNPEFGATPEGMLFEIYDQDSALALMNHIYTSVLRFEPRVRMIFSGSSVIADPDNHLFKIDLCYSVKGFEGQQFHISKLVSF